MEDYFGSFSFALLRPETAPLFDPAPLEPELDVAAVLDGAEDAGLPEEPDEAVLVERGSRNQSE